MIIGILIGIVLGVGIGILLPNIKSRLKPIEKGELSDEEKANIEKQKELRKNFEELMNYDYQTALRGDK